MWLAIITASGPPTCQLVHADRFKDPELQDLHWHSSALGFHIQFSCDYSIAALLNACQHLWDRWCSQISFNDCVVSLGCPLGSELVGEE